VLASPETVTVTLKWHPSGVTAEQLIEFVATRLSVHKPPRRVYFIGALPRDAMGNVVKSGLAASYR
jgi:acyl-CoA synthetase (AMP-forming)/AMP-acid ligase II